MSIIILNTRYRPGRSIFVFDVLSVAASYIEYKKDINIYLVPIHGYNAIKDKNINIWNFEPILQKCPTHKLRRDMMEKAIEDKNVINIFSFDLLQTKIYNHEKVKYFPFGYIEQMVTSKNNNKNGICFLGGMSSKREAVLKQYNPVVLDISNYKSYEDRKNDISEYKYGLDTPTKKSFMNFYVNCLRISQYIMSKTIVVSDNIQISDSFGVKSYIYSENISNAKIIDSAENLADRALDELKNNANMEKIFLEYNL